MLHVKTKDTRRLRILSLGLMVVLATAAFLGCLSEAFATFNAQSTDRIIGVGRIQSTSTSEQAVAPDDDFATAKLSGIATSSLANAGGRDEASASTNQLVKPLDRTLDTAEQTAATAQSIKRFGEPDAAGWFTAKASAYGPSSADSWTALGTELTLSSADIAIDINCSDLLGRVIDVQYGGVIMRTRIVDVGNLAVSGRLFDLQPGLCLAFGAPTPEFGWGVRTVQWRFVN
ncbi:MAG: hypothetical protein LBU07_06205 [Coriobacteriales bacterium]|nr:hypothetical protein [Coriobacteriales bacterium]